MIIMLKITRYERDLLLQKFPDEKLARAGKRYGRRSDYYIAEKPELLYELWKLRNGKSAAQMPKENKIDGTEKIQRPTAAGSRPQATGSRAPQIRRPAGSSAGQDQRRKEFRQDLLIDLMIEQAGAIS